MSPLSKKLFLVICMALLAVPVLAQQTRAELERRRKQHEQEIKMTRKLLQETKKKEKVTLNQLEIIGSQIKTRNQLINTISSEIEVVQLRIEDLNKNIADIQEDLREMKAEYAEIILASYKQRNTYDKIMYILAAENFQQALRRLKYLQQFSAYRQKQIDLILATQKLLAEKLRELIAVRQEKKELLTDKETEKKELEVDKQEEARVLTSLQKEEKELMEQLRQKEEAARKLKRAIDDLIEKELAEARRRAAEEARKKGGSTAKTDNSSKTEKAGSGEMKLTPEAAQLAGEFSRNKGSLPWPVEQGFISKTFGTHPHPTLKNITVNNTGIDITTNKDARVRALFKGQVKMKFSVPGMGKAVIIAHGDYYTVYTNLDEVYVKEGDKVNTKQEIGTVMYDEEEEKAELHIEIYKVKNRLDPQEWLFSK